MVRHWMTERGAGWQRSAVINGLDRSYTVFGADTKRHFRLLNPDGWFRSRRLAGVVRLPAGT